MKNQKEQFKEIVNVFEVKCNGNEEMLNAVHEAEAFFADNYERYKQDTLAETMSNMWYCENTDNYGGKSMFRQCFGAMQRAAKGAKIKA